jgi:hypothetical protein
VDVFVGGRPWSSSICISIPILDALPNIGARTNTPLLPPLLILNSPRKMKFSYFFSDLNQPPGFPVQTKTPSFICQLASGTTQPEKSRPLKSGTIPRASPAPKAPKPFHRQT